MWWQAHCFEGRHNGIQAACHGTHVFKQQLSVRLAREEHAGRAATTAEQLAEAGGGICTRGDTTQYIWQGKWRQCWTFLGIWQGIWRHLCSLLRGGTKAATASHAPWPCPKQDGGIVPPVRLAPALEVAGDEGVLHRLGVCHAQTVLLHIDRAAAAQAMGMVTAASGSQAQPAAKRHVNQPGQRLGANRTCTLTQRTSRSSPPAHPLRPPAPPGSAAGRWVGLSGPPTAGRKGRPAQTAGCSGPHRR